MSVDALNRRSRWSDAGGKKIDFKPSDYPVLRALNPTRYSFLPTSYIAALIDRSVSKVSDRITELRRPPNHYIRLAPECRERPSNTAQFVYELGSQGAQALRAEGEKVGRIFYGGDQDRFLSHQLMIDTTWASIEIASKGAARLVLAKELVDDPRFPKTQRLEKRPLTIPVDIEWTNPRTGKRLTKKFVYTHDDIRALDISRNGQTFRRPLQIEAENKDRVDCGNLDQGSFLRKFLALEQIMHKQLYKKHWGLERLLTLVVTPSEERINTMKSVILRENPRGASYILFRKIPMFGVTLNPIGELYTGPWERAGHPPFFLNNLDPQ